MGVQKVAGERAFAAFALRCAFGHADGRPRCVRVLVAQAQWSPDRSSGLAVKRGVTVTMVTVQRRSRRTVRACTAVTSPVLSCFANRQQPELGLFSLDFPLLPSRMSSCDIWKRFLYFQRQVNLNRFGQLIVDLSRPRVTLEPPVGKSFFLGLVKRRVNAIVGCRRGSSWEQARSYSGVSTFS